MSSAWEDLERFRTLVLELGLPRQNMAYVGLRCPYCGKSDRIHRLESASELDDPPAEYAEFWMRYGNRGCIMVCSFCRQVLLRDGDMGVVPIAEDETERSSP